MRRLFSAKNERFVPRNSTTGDLSKIDSVNIESVVTLSSAVRSDQLRVRSYRWVNNKIALNSIRRVRLSTGRFSVPFVYSTDISTTICIFILNRQFEETSIDMFATPIRMENVPAGFRVFELPRIMTRLNAVSAEGNEEIPSCCEPN